jgi:hypothetical protein
MDLSPAHYHLLLNHIPVVAPFFLALLMIIGMIRGSRELLRMTLVLTVLLPVATYVVSLTGEKAEHYVEEQPWYDEDRVHQHEERAEAAVIVSAVTGVLALLALWVSRKGAPLKPAMALLVLGSIVVSAGMVSLTALDGGMIRHDELRAVDESVEV